MDLIYIFFYQQMLHQVFLWSHIGSWFHRTKIKQEIIHRNVKTSVCGVHVSYTYIIHPGFVDKNNNLLFRDLKEVGHS